MRTHSFRSRLKIEEKWWKGRGGGDISIRDRVIGYSAWKSSRMWAAPADDSSFEQIVSDDYQSSLHLRELRFK